MSDTPRTDALIRFEFGDTGQPFPAHALLAMMQHARQLERELAAANAERERYEQLKAMFDHGGVTIRLIGEVDNLGIPLVTYEYTDWEPLQAAIDAAIAAKEKP